MKALLRLLGLAAVATFLSAPIATATTVFFAGLGASGVDTFGDTWVAAASPTRDSWGMPGLGLGSEVFLGLSTFTDFHIVFNLPEGVKIDSTPASKGDGFEETTRFSVSPFSSDTSSLWTPTFSGDGFGVSFLAPSSAVVLSPGLLFFVNVTFTGAIDPEVLNFSAAWTQTEVHAPVPEPATISLMGLGIVAAALRRLRH